MNTPNPGRSVITAVLFLWAGVAAAHDEQVPGADVRSSKEAKLIDRLLRQPEEEIDLARVKLTVDKIIDSTTDVDAGIREIDALTARVRAMLPPVSSPRQRLVSMQTFFYEAGPWNAQSAYGYDFDDPLGKNIRKKLLMTYLRSRKGNCVTMPFLFLIVGQRLGIDLTASTAPLHVFVKYKDNDTGLEYNLEATSGAKPARDEWIRQQNPMTDAAIENGLYMRALSKRETAAVMATLLVEHFASKGEYEKVIALSDLILEHYPKSVACMLWKGSAYGRLATKHFVSRYPRPDLIPQGERGYFDYLSKQNRLWFAKAEALGWREPDPESERKYIQTIVQHKTQ